MIWNEYDIVDTSKNFFMIPARGTGGSMIYRLGTELPWLCDYGFNMFVDFCIWTLVTIHRGTEHCELQGWMHKDGEYGQMK